MIFVRNQTCKIRRRAVYFVIAFCLLTSASVIQLQAAVTLPIEVLGLDGTIESVTVNVPSARGVDGLWMQVNNLSYPNPLVPYAKASLRINKSSWIDLTNATVNVEGLGKAYKGIGGVFSTLKLTVPLPVGSMVDGDNTIDFRFSKTDGVSSGYRVIRLHFTAGGVAVSQSRFPDEDVSAWKPPPSGKAAKGKALWTGSKPLIASPLSNAVKIRARCMDCHTNDGRDLKYFNYSNKSIHARAVFHGLSDKEGDDLAAYIRSLNTPAPKSARPWNPPYQPGTGLDSRPIVEWSAGAGIDAVLESDQDLLPYIFPGGRITKEAISATATPRTYHNMREIPTPMQFLDWNHWLPRVYPGDAWPDWEGSKALKSYYDLRAKLKKVGVNDRSYFGFVKDWGNWSVALRDFRLSKTLAPSTAKRWTNDFSEKLYSRAQWVDVKNWELMQEFQLEGLGGKFCSERGPDIGEPRAWSINFPFRTSTPHMIDIPRDARGFIDEFTTRILQDLWYRLETVLFGNRFTYDQNHLHWDYSWRYMQENQAASGSPNIMQQLLLLVKGQEITNNGLGPDQSVLGWAPGRAADPSRLTRPEYVDLSWSNTPSKTRKQIAEAVLGSWIDKNLQYPTTAYLGGPVPIIKDPNYIPTGRLEEGSDLGDKIFGMIPYYRRLGVNEALLRSIIDWAQKLYPKGNWDLIRSKTTTRK